LLRGEVDGDANFRLRREREGDEARKNGKELEKFTHDTPRMNGK
jgi:hypothetical protein